jgi:ABC-type Mn2+/Zn2+ transport system permease subunit
MLEVIPIVAIVFSFSTGFGIIYVLVAARNKERMALIEKGIDASIFNMDRSAKPTLKRGMLFVGVAIGFLVGYMLDVYTEMEEPLPYFAMIFLFGGLSLIAFYFLDQKQRAQENQQEQDKRID